MNLLRMYLPPWNNSRITIEKEQCTDRRHTKQQIEALKKQLETKQERLDERRDEILANANEEAHTYPGRKPKEYADETMKHFHKLRQRPLCDTAAVEKERQNVSVARMNTSETKHFPSKLRRRNRSKKLSAKDLSAWRYVFAVLSMNLNGTVSSLSGCQRLSFRTDGYPPFPGHISDLELIDEPVISASALQNDR